MKLGPQSKAIENWWGLKDECVREAIQSCGSVLTNGLLPFLKDSLALESKLGFTRIWVYRTRLICLRLNCYKGGTCPFCDSHTCVFLPGVYFPFLLLYHVITDIENQVQLPNFVQNCRPSQTFLCYLPSLRYLLLQSPIIRPTAKHSHMSYLSDLAIVFIQF